MSDLKPEMKEFICRCKAVMNVLLQPIADKNEMMFFSCPNCAERHSLVNGTPIQTEAITIVKDGINIQPHDLDPRKIYDILVKKGAGFLFHANTVRTSCTYMEQGSLLSRQQVEQRGLFQTNQYTDWLDKQYHIYNDVFLDFVDIHARKRDINHYGPILFEFPLTLLITHPLSFVRITKVNPDRWLPNDSLERRYFTSAEEFEQHYQLGNFGAMMLLPYIEGELQLSVYNITNIIALHSPKCLCRFACW